MTWSDVLTAAGYWDGGDLLTVPTSGTSGGSPRVVLRTVESWLESFAPFSEATGITPDDVIVAAGPPTSMLVYARAHAAAIGAVTIDPIRWQPRLLTGATVAHLTPTMLFDALQEPSRSGWRRSLRTVVVAGAALSPGLRATAREAGLDVVEYYGAAELSFVAIGRGSLAPFSGVEIEIREDVIWVRSPWTALGYAPGLDGPMRTVESWCTVGDRGAIVGGALEVHGRPGQVLTGGVSVITADVESVVRGSSAVVDCAVFGLPHQRLGEELVAVVVGGDRATVTAACRASLPAPARPVRWFSARRLPMTVAGKVDLPELRRLVLAGEVPRWR